jgi:hypothetical protein
MMTGTDRHPFREGAVTDARPSSADDAATNVRKPAASPTPEKSSSDARQKNQTKPRLAIVAAILVIGAVAFVWARNILPKEPPVNSYATYQVTIKEGGSPGGRPVESFNFERQSNGTIKINWTYSPGFTSTGSGSGDQILDVDTSLALVGPDIKVLQCPDPRGCRPTINNQSANETVLDFASSSLFKQTETAIVRDPSLGFTYNNESALAEMPYVSVVSFPTASSTGKGQRSSIVANDIPVSLNFGYDIPHGYDWSLPPISAGSGAVTWEETVDPNIGQPAQQLAGQAQAVELTGSNPVAQANDNQAIFVSGVLFGVAGAAALSAVIEFLHLIFKIT